MQPFSRILLLLTLLAFSFSQGIQAQDCSKIIKENKKISGIQIANTANLSVVIRGGYTYFVEFFTNEKGIFARFTSQGGIEFNQDDQVVFVDANGKEKAYKFTGMDELIAGAVPTHRNNLRLDMAAIQWLAESNITGINFINFVDRQKYKFTINAERQGEFKNLVTCFNAILDKMSVVDTPGASVSKPEPAATPAGGANTAGGPAKPGAKPAAGATPATAGGDPEVAALRSELEKTKEKIRADIKAEKERGDAIKIQLQQEVAAAREAANAKKLEYSNEVLEARKASLRKLKKQRPRLRLLFLKAKLKPTLLW